MVFSEADISLSTDSGNEAGSKEPNSQAAEKKDWEISPFHGLGLLFVSASLFILAGIAWIGGPLWFWAGVLPVMSFAFPTIAWGLSSGRISAVLPSKRITSRKIWVALIIIVGGSLTGLAMAALSSRLPGASSENAFFLKWILKVPPLQQFAFFVIIPAFCEEILFRGGLIASLRKLPVPVICVTSGSIFALFHWSVYRFLPVAILGTALAVVVVKTGNIWLSMCGHAMHNGLIILIMDYSGQNESGGNFPWLFVICMAVVGISLFTTGCIVKPEKDSPEPDTTEGGSEL